MTYSADFLDKGNHMVVRAHGDLSDMDMVVENVRGILERVFKASHSRLLVCVNELDIVLDAFDAITSVDMLTRILPDSKGVRIACVAAPEKARQYELLETIFRNRSFNFRSFCSEDEAESWLLG